MGAQASALMGVSQVAEALPSASFCKFLLFLAAHTSKNFHLWQVFGLLAQQRHVPGDEAGCCAFAKLALFLPGSINWTFVAFVYIFFKKNLRMKN